MSDMVDIQHGLRGLIFSFIGIISAYLIKDIAKGIWFFINRNKRPTREEFKDLTKALNHNSDLLMNQKLVIEKLSEDIRRIYLFLKIMAKEKWPDYRRQVEELENLNRKQGDL
jgi:hypothetical protein